MALPISLIGAPTDIGAGSLGARMGPEAMRVAGLQAALERHGLQVHDLGNLAGPANPWLPPENGYRHLAEVVAWNQAVHDAMLAELQRQRLPILLGGDHCLGHRLDQRGGAPLPRGGQEAARAVAGRACRLQHRDLTPSGNLHGMPVACLCGLGPRPNWSRWAARCRR
jgi:arginase